MLHIRSLLLIIIVTCLLQSCSTTKRTAGNKAGKVAEPTHAQIVLSSFKHKSNVPARSINKKNISADSIVKFAETLIGVRYKYGSANKNEGFDCSGFITYVFSNFHITVPRSSIDFTNAGKTIEYTDSKKGDLILFTGYDTTGWIVGHMGIIIENNKGKIRFIHSASGKNKEVMISDMTNYFLIRFVKVIRIFN